MLTGRPLEIASGKSDLPKHKVEQYRELWASRGIELPEIDWDDVPDAVPVDHKALVPNGPGTELKNIYSQYGFPPCQFCIQLAVDMDRWGVSGCRSRLDEIVDGVVEHTKTWAADAEAEGHKVKAYQRIMAQFSDCTKRLAIKHDVLRAIGVAEAQLQKKLDDVAGKLPPGVWDNPVVDDADAYVEFVSAWEK